MSYIGWSDVAWQIANTGGTGITTKSALDATGARTAVADGTHTGYLGFDLHGNTALAENGAKTVTDALRYDAWGEVIASASSGLSSPWRYQGRLDIGPDTTNPLYDFGARTYRPVEGTFTSLDSYAGQVLDPLSMNRFLYAEANPATLVDPDGHKTCRGNNDANCDSFTGLTPTQAQAVQKTWDAKYGGVGSAGWWIDKQEISHAKAGGAATYVPAGDYLTPSSFSLTVPVSNMALAACPTCVADSTGYVYDPNGLDPWGSPFPLACTGARDVRGCLQYVTYLNDTNHLPTAAQISLGASTLAIPLDIAAVAGAFSGPADLPAYVAGGLTAVAIAAGAIAATSSCIVAPSASCGPDAGAFVFALTGPVAAAAKGARLLLQNVADTYHLAGDAASAVLGWLGQLDPRYNH